jgi:predicted AlkP superfamily phosphohydrolase/phosphomutase
MNTKNKLIGKKIKGFKFDSGKVYYSHLMDKHIGEIGTIINYDDNQNYFDVDFGYKQWAYPAELIEQHLVEENPLDDLPIIGDGVLMEVSVDGITWDARNVIGITKENKIIAHVDGGMLSYGFWKHARPITPKTKITRKEFESKFEIID